MLTRLKKIDVQLQSEIAVSAEQQDSKHNDKADNSQSSAVVSFNTLF